MNDRATLALIPARSGSKRLPRKNILSLGGHPLIAWTIKAASEVAGVRQVMVSTDSREIATIAESYGASAPFLRNQELSSDWASSVAVALDALERAEKHFATSYDRLLLLQPTSPFRSSQHIQEALALFEDRSAKAVVSVCRCEHPPQWCNVLPEDKSMANFLREEVKGKRSQDFPQQYRINGALYLIDTAELRRHQTFVLAHGSYAYCMDVRSSLDIDESEDYELACTLANRGSLQGREFTLPY